MKKKVQTVNRSKPKATNIGKSHNTLVFTVRGKRQPQTVRLNKKPLCLVKGNAQVGFYVANHSKQQIVVIVPTKLQDHFFATPDGQWRVTLGPNQRTERPYVLNQTLKLKHDGDYQFTPLGPDTLSIKFETLPPRGPGPLPDSDVIVEC